VWFPYGPNMCANFQRNLRGWRFFFVDLVWNDPHTQLIKYSNRTVTSGISYCTISLSVNDVLFTCSNSSRRPTTLIQSSCHPLHTSEEAVTAVHKGTSPICSPVSSTDQTVGHSSSSLVPCTGLDGARRERKLQWVANSVIGWVGVKYMSVCILNLYLEVFNSVYLYLNCFLIPGLHFILYMMTCTITSFTLIV